MSREAARPESGYIERSAARCRGFGVGRERIYSSRILDEAGLRERLARKRDLIVTAEPFVSRLYDFVRGSGFFAILTDEEGCILSVIGDEGILGEAFRLRMVPGAFMDEGSIGTNAMGTALTEGLPLQVSGDEHYIAAYRRWTCSCAPIRGPGGEIVGALDLTGDRGDVHLHTLGMVVAAAHAIEATLALASRNEALRENTSFTETLLDSIAAGIVSADLDGKILSANRHALAMFGYTREELEREGAAGILPGWEAVKAACVGGSDLRNEDVPVKAAANRLFLNLATYPIRGEDGVPRGVILVFKDVRKARRHADELLGRRAVYTFDKILGVSSGLLGAIEFAKKVADSRSTILITGESGTGKEIFAQAIQNASSRREEAFVVLNCGAIPPTLIESELFGYVDGAFTGARRGGQPGKFEIADGGTIFLDEIGDMPLDMQTRLLRVIEEGTVTRIGESREAPVDVRVIAATNRDLAGDVASGRFRKDLFYRLNVLPIHIPPLRERREDIPVLLEHYMARISRKLNRRPLALDGEMVARLVAYDWPGNVRELENLIELMVNSGTPPAWLARPASRRGSAPQPPGPPSLSLREAERRLIEETLESCGYNVSLAARSLTIGRNTLYRKMKAFGIPCSAE